uniref:Uncharacterized protein n=1 Tax=Tanacetum cinerariifolium TaxID=118510 RepID=A0A699HAP8_TANCI|nr:hypothetical protein [Tanacetum cinerariifolium]
MYRTHPRTIKDRRMGWPMVKVVLWWDRDDGAIAVAMKVAMVATGWWRQRWCGVEDGCDEWLWWWHGGVVDDVGEVMMAYGGGRNLAGGGQSGAVKLKEGK